ncbi:hypothetical protein AOLI_G00187110 [Acnodon oligacanthus]
MITSWNTEFRHWAAVLPTLSHHWSTRLAIRAYGPWPCLLIGAEAHLISAPRLLPPTHGDTSAGKHGK